MELSSGWRRRRPRAEAANASAADDSSSEAAADADMVDDLLNMSVQHVGARAARPGRAIRRAKRMKVDLAATTGDGDGSMFAELAFAEEPPPTEEEEHAGSALLCFISAESFVGFVELPGSVLKLSGTETLSECSRELCGAVDCCGDKAYLVSVQLATSLARKKRTFLARSTGVGDYVAFTGKGMRFDTDSVPGDGQREQVLARHFGSLPRAVRREAVLCVGRMSLQWRGLAAAQQEQAQAQAQRERAQSRGPEDQEGYTGDQSSEGGSSADEAGMRSILPMLERMPVGGARGLGTGLDELIARGGTPMPDDGEEAWL